MYPIVILMGLSQSIALNTSINLIGEVVGLRGDKGAIVYGVYSLFDKTSNGLILYFIMVNLDINHPLMISRHQRHSRIKMNSSRD